MTCCLDVRLGGVHMGNMVAGDRQGHCAGAPIPKQVQGVFRIGSVRGSRAQPLPIVELFGKDADVPGRSWTDRHSKVATVDIKQRRPWSVMRPRLGWQVVARIRVVPMLRTVRGRAQCSWTGPIDEVTCERLKLATIAKIDQFVSIVRQQTNSALQVLLFLVCRGDLRSVIACIIFRRRLPMPRRRFRRPPIPRSPDPTTSLSGTPIMSALRPPSSKTGHPCWKSHLRQCN